LLAVTRGRPVLILTLLALALPAPAALAQSAGDDQYQDPLGGGSTQTAPSKPSQPAQPAQSGGGNSGSSQSGSQSQTPRRAHSVPLARTGFDARIPAAAGLVLLVGGVLLLIRTRRQPT
jgi:LPXTG-motif cell wall-anchored protein